MIRSWAIGIVGGRLVSWEQLGREAAEMALRIMRGEPAAFIPFGGETAYVDISERKETEDALRRSEQDLSKLAGRIIHAQEEELRRLFRELHDDLTRRLAALALDAALIEKELNPLPPQAVRGFKELRADLSEVAEEVHGLSRQLHPSILDELGLVQAVQAECAAFTRKTGIDLSFAPHDFPDSVSQQPALCLYRVIREALQNIAKHSRAAAASVTLQGLSDGTRLLIEDKGIGFDPQEVKTKAGIGLSSMRERSGSSTAPYPLNQNRDKAPKLRFLFRLFQLKEMV